MDECVFCLIVAHRAPADIIAETDDSIVFLSLENHPLVVPMTHVPTSYALDDALAAQDDGATLPAPFTI